MKKVLIFIFIFLILTAIFLFGFILLNNKNEKQPMILINNNQDQICLLDEDCVPKEALMGIRYFCQEQKCASEVLGNPASINCQEKGGSLDIRHDFRNQEYGVCIFQDRSECDEWKFFKGECAQGDFYLSGNIWGGKIVSLRGAKFDDYFEMLNGDTIGIAGINQKINETLSALQDKDAVIKVSGKILNTANDVDGKRLTVNKIIDMGGFKFKEISKEDSLKIIKDRIKTSYEYLDDKGVDLSLTETAIQSMPYSWIFNFLYKDFSGLEKKVEVKIQKGEVKYIIFKKGTNDKLYNCDEFAFTKICSKDYNPVCAKIEKKDFKINPKIIEDSENQTAWKTFTNACAACLYSLKTETVIGYKTGECE